MEEQVHAPASVELAAALASARRAMVEVLMRLLAAWEWVAVVPDVLNW